MRSARGRKAIEFRDKASRSARRRLAPNVPPSWSRPFTETCWPSTARTASSKPSNAPGTRSPGKRRTVAGEHGVLRQQRAHRIGHRAEIEQLLDARDHRTDDRSQRRRHFHIQGDCRSARIDTAIHP